MKKTKRGFSLVELVVAVAIVVMLTVAAYLGIRQVQDMMKNNRITNDLIAIESSLNQYYKDHGEKYPHPDFYQPLDMNILCFTAEAAFSECDSAAFYQGRIDDKLLTKRYLAEIPKDPWTGANYAYGVSADGKYFMIAGVRKGDGEAYSASVIGNLFKGYRLPSLIRAYDSQNFVTDKGRFLPYSPDPTKLSARLLNMTGVVGITDKDGLVKNPADTLYPGDTLTTGSGGSADIFFSDGSVTHLSENSMLTISSTSSSEKGDDGNVVTKIRLKLLNGKIWNKVARLAEKSEFNVETTSAIAGVRGTEFGACVNDPDLCPSGETVILKSGRVEVSKTNASGAPIGTLVVLETISGAVMIDAGKMSLSPADVQPVAASSPEQSFIDANRTPPLHSGIYPYILVFDIPKTGTANSDVFIASVGMNGFTSEDYDVTGFEVFPKRLFSESGERLINDGVLDEAGRPLASDVLTLGPGNHVDSVGELTAGTFTYDDEERVYKIAFPMPSLDEKGFYSQEGLVVRAYRDYDSGTGNRAYSNFSWPPINFVVSDSILSEEAIFADFRGSSPYKPIAPDSCKILITTPVENSTDVAITPEFRWRTMGECAEVVHYELKLAQNGTASAPQTVSGNFFAWPEELGANTAYTVSVTAVGTDGNALASGKSLFTIGSGAAPAGELTSIALHPVTPSPWISDGSRYAVDATGTYSDGSTEGVTTACDWSTDNPFVSVDGYWFIPNENLDESVTITCAIGGISQSVLVNIDKPAPALSSITVAINGAASASVLSDGSTYPVSATGTYSDNSAADVTSQCGWSVNLLSGSGSPGTVTVNTATNTAVFLPVFISTGQYQLVCKIVAPSGVTTQNAGGGLVTVTAPLPSSITVTPSSNSIVSDGTTSYTVHAAGKYSATVTADVTSQCAWSVTSSGVTGAFSGAGTGTVRFMPTANTSGSLKLVCKMSAGGTSVTGPSPSVTVTAPAPTLASVCNTANGGYWDGSACWIMGAAGQACSDPDGSGSKTGACEDFGLANDVTASCNPATTWNDCGTDGSCGASVPTGDDGEICLGLNAGAAMTTSYVSSQFAPYWIDDGAAQNCRLRNSSALVSCTKEPSVVSGMTFRRLCSCVE
jgi:prepilin-type N-terminal cleavage/methylation domain-containing protein